MNHLFSLKSTSVVVVALAALFLGARGCSRTATLTGKVTYQDRPVVYGSVVVVGADGKAASGVIQADGSYEVDGVPPGDVKIAVISRDPSTGRSILRGRRPAPRPTKSGKLPQIRQDGWFPLPSKLEDPENSGLACTLSRGSNSFNIELP
jgi:hypothetical protein